MVSKKEKALDINKALKRVGSRSYAEILPDKRIEYITYGRSSLGKEYKMKASLSDMYNQMHGEDIRALKKKYGRR